MAALESTRPRVGGGRRTGTRFVINRQPWMDDARCAGTDPRLFFPDKGDSTREAKRLCGGCVVRAECLLYALPQSDLRGIWGGLSENQRTRLRKANGIEAKASLGRAVA